MLRIRFPTYLVRVLHIIRISMVLPIFNIVDRCLLIYFSLWGKRKWGRLICMNGVGTSVRLRLRILLLLSKLPTLTHYLQFLFTNNLTSRMNKQTKKRRKKKSQQNLKKKKKVCRRSRHDCPWLILNLMLDYLLLVSVYYLVFLKNKRKKPFYSLNVQFPVP